MSDDKSSQFQLIIAKALNATGYGTISDVMCVVNQCVIQGMFALINKAITHKLKITGENVINLSLGSFSYS